MSIKFIEFSGKYFKIWSQKFCAHANRKGYYTLLRGIQTIPAISQYIATGGDPTNATNESIIKLWKLNELAYEGIYYLSTVLPTEAKQPSIYLVDNSVTLEQPDGNCKIARQKPTQKYLSKTATSYINLTAGGTVTCAWHSSLKVMCSIPSLTQPKKAHQGGNA